MPDSLSPYADPPLVRTDYSDPDAIPPHETPVAHDAEVRGTGWAGPVPDKPPFEFSREHDGTLSLESAVFQALGYASTCWESLTGTGVFQSDRAKECGEALVTWIREWYVGGAGIGPNAEKIDPGVKYDDTHGPIVQIGDGMITHPDPDETVWLAIDGHGVGNTVAAWLELLQRLHELQEHR